MCTPRFLIVTTVTVTVGRDLLLYKAVVPTGDGDVLADEHLRVALLSLRQCLDERVVRIAAEEFVDDSLRVAAQHAPNWLHISWNPLRPAPPPTFCYFMTTFLLLLIYTPFVVGLPLRRRPSSVYQLLPLARC